jgi:hypothetical protein
MTTDDDLPRRLMEAARRDSLTTADRIAIGQAIARIQAASLPTSGYVRLSPAPPEGAPTEWDNAHRAAQEQTARDLSYVAEIFSRTGPDAQAQGGA